MKLKNKNQQGGFIQIFVILVLILLVAAFMGYNPAEVWNNILFPIINFIWKLVVLCVDILMKLLKDGGQALADLVNFIKNLLNAAK